MCTVLPLYNDTLWDTVKVFAEERELLKRGKIKNKLLVWETVTCVAEERELLKRGPLKRGSTVILCINDKRACVENQKLN